MAAAKAGAERKLRRILEVFVYEIFSQRNLQNQQKFHLSKQSSSSHDVDVCFLKLCFMKE